MTIKQRIARLLALLMLGSLLSAALTGCSEQTVNEGLDFALELADSGNDTRENGADELTLIEPQDPLPDETEEAPKKSYIATIREKIRKRKK